MRVHHAVSFLAVTLMFASAMPLAATAEDFSQLAAAQRHLEMAQLHLRLYERDEYPKAVSRLKRSITLATAQLESHRRRVKEFEQFDKFKYSSPLFYSLEQARLAVLESELRLEQLEEELRLLYRNHQARRRLLELEVAAAAAQLAALHD